MMGVPENFEIQVPDPLAITATLHDIVASGDRLLGSLFRERIRRPARVPELPGDELGIGRAFARDVQRLELDRRLQQVELEHLLLRRPLPALEALPQAHAVAWTGPERSGGGTDRGAATTTPPVTIGSGAAPAFERRSLSSAPDVQPV